MPFFPRTNKDMFKFLLVYFTQKYINPEFMGQDAVFIHIFEKYINMGQADFSRKSTGNLWTTVLIVSWPT
jgi:hypothetical protein